MLLIQTIKNKLRNIRNRNERISPKAAYNLWASTYDKQTDNVLIYLDEVVFKEMLSAISIRNKTIVDIGCGTGRHWEKIITQNPKQLIGYDISGEMLKKLQAKYPGSKTYLDNDGLTEIENESCDIIFSNLTIGYMPDLEKTFNQWNRILKNGGHVLITDFHPDELKKGAERSFKTNGRNYKIRNYIHSLDKIETLAIKMKWNLVEMITGKIDDSVRPFYERKGAMEVYYKNLGSLLLYGCKFDKAS